MKREKFITLDILKFFAMIVVFLFHFFFEGQKFLYIDFTKQLSFLSNGFISMGVLVNVLFFMISGFLLSLHYDGDIKKFYKKRIIKILIPYYILYIILYLKNAYFSKKILLFSILEAPQLIFTILGIDTYLSFLGFKTLSMGIGEWFLGCLIVYYFLFPFLYKYKKCDKIKIEILVIIYFVLTKFNFMQIPINQNILINIFNFYAGILIFDYYKNNIKEGGDKDLKKIELSLIVSFIFFILIIFFGEVVDLILNFTRQFSIFKRNYVRVEEIINPMLVASSFSVILILFCICIESLKKEILNFASLKKIVNWFNNYFYNIFLTHHIVIITIYSQFIKYNVKFNFIARYGLNSVLIILCIIDIIGTALFSIFIKNIEIIVFKLLKSKEITNHIKV